MAEVNSSDLEERFDEGRDITGFMDMSTLTRPNQTAPAKRISIDMPPELVSGLDRMASRMGVNRQAVIKVWLTERLDLEAEREKARSV